MTAWDIEGFCLLLAKQLVVGMEGTRVAGSSVIDKGVSSSEPLCQGRFFYKAR